MRTSSIVRFVAALAWRRKTLVPVLDDRQPEADPFIAQAIYRHSGSSPPFIEELRHAAAAGSAVGPDHRGSGVALPLSGRSADVRALPDNAGEAFQARCMARYPECREKRTTAARCAAIASCPAGC